MFGCGCSWGVPWTVTAGGESWEGRGKVTAASVDDPRVARTCPRWFWMSPEVQTILAWLPDYKRAAMGPVQHLEAPLLEYLRIAEAAEAAWEASIAKPKKHGGG